MSTALVVQDGSAPAYTEPPLTGIQPISVKKTLMIVNSFVSSTAEFLNKFACLCEQKLSRVSEQVQRVEIVLSLLEAKLDSIGWMTPSAGGGAAAVAQPAISASSSAPAAPPMDGSVPAAPALNAPPAPALSAPAAAAASDVPLLRVKDDQRYARYFKMLTMGVPKAAVRIKMSAEGVDPDVIDMDPEAAAPPGAQQSQALVAIEGAQDGGSDSEKSDQMSDEEGN